MEISIILASFLEIWIRGNGKPVEQTIIININIKHKHCIFDAGAQ